ncbi:hypothetical protein BGZ54_000849 [Gamsiella multidivaricata]|nr:hypothetical protein BGZ54_000849 [Gamsiella multidivaricata]
MPVSQQSNKTVLTHPLGASAEVHFFGATLTSWKVASEERIFLSEKAVLDGSKAIRGGIPLVFPVFGKGKAPHVTASLPQHGFARISRWRLVNSSEDAHTVTAQFGLDHNMISEEHRKMWPFDFSLVYTVKLGAETIETHLKIQNTGDQAFDFNTLLHTYFLIPTADIQIQYGGEDGGVQLHRNGVNDIVVWNPWTEKAAGMADFGDEEYHRMICVEAGQVAEFIALAAGGSWEGSQVLSLL